MKDKSGDKARVLHILDAISEIESYVSNDSFESFSSHSMKKFATVKQLEIIGIRNILIHEYFGVDERIVWEVVNNDLPVLKKQIEAILKEHF